MLKSTKRVRLKRKIYLILRMFSFAIENDLSVDSIIPVFNKNIKDYENEIKSKNY